MKTLQVFFSVYKCKLIHICTSKNLFLTDKKGKYILVVLSEDKKANIKEISALSNVSHLSFATPDELKSVLGLEIGSVTPFGIINDSDNKVELVIDSSLKGETLLFHPNVNNKTVSVKYEDLIKFIEYEDHKYLFLS